MEIYAGDYYPTIEANETKQATYSEKACALGAKDCPKAAVGAPAIPVSDTDDTQEAGLPDAVATDGA